MRWFNFLDNFEARMDQFTPRLESTAELSKSYSVEEFDTLIKELPKKCGLKPKTSAEESMHIFGFNGWKFGDPQDIRDAFENDSMAEMYLDTTTRFELHRTEDGIVHVSSFEHVAGPSQQIAGYKVLLAIRLTQLLGMIDPDRTD